MDRHGAILRAVTRNIPLQFIKRVRDVMPQVYAEAFGRTYRDPLFGQDSPEAHDLIGQERHYIFQAKLPKIAQECGMSCPAVPNSRHTAYYRLIRTGRFMLTASAVKSPRETPRFAEFRKKLAAVNNLMVQRVLEFMPLAEIQDNDTGMFSAIIIHGPHPTNPAWPGFVQLGIPSPRRQKWVFCESLDYILEAYKVDTAAVAAETLLDKAQPKRRQIRRSKGGKE